MRERILIGHQNVRTGSCRFYHRWLHLALIFALLVTGLAGAGLFAAPATAWADTTTMSYTVVKEGYAEEKMPVGQIGTIIPEITKKHVGCTFTYESTDDTKLFVSNNGVYVTMSAGEAGIVVTGKDAEGKTVYSGQLGLTITNEIMSEAASIALSGEAGIATGPVYKWSGLTLNAGGLLMAPGDVSVLSATNTTAKVTWESSDPSIATVDEDGNVTAVKEGNCIIYGKAGGARSGCAVAVTSAVKKHAVNYAKAYAASATYSQANRMQDGYYDCSALVFRSYKKFGTYLCGVYYAMTAADYGKWFVEHDQAVEGGLSPENVQNMVLQAGDLYCQSGPNNNGRYRNIYHVEMFAGYIFKGFDKDGSPILGTLWANARQDAYREDGGIMGRP